MLTVYLFAVFLFDKLTPNQKIQAANIDCMRHHKFALLSGVICMGKSEVKADIPTACTDGKNKFYGADFIEGSTRQQLRYLVLHENFHVALKHCVLPMYHTYVKKFGPMLCNMAMDYVVNGMIEELDPDFKFVERPTKVALLFISCLNVSQCLLSLHDETFETKEECEIENEKYLINGQCVEVEK